MKHLTRISILLVLFAFTKNATSQVYQKGDFVCNLFYGSPSMRTLTIRNSEKQQGNSRFNTYGPIGIQPEFLVSKNIGVGGEISFANTVFGSEQELRLTEFRFMPRFSIHLGNSSKFENHFSFAAGYRKAEINFTTGGLFSELFDWQYTYPFSLRVSWGCKYFLTDKLGLSFDIGLGGGSTITGGLAYRTNFFKK